MRNPARVPSERMFMCCWQAYTTDSNCNEDNHASSITWDGSFRSNHTCGGSTLDRELGGYSGTAWTIYTRVTTQSQGEGHTYPGLLLEPVPTAWAAYSTHVHLGQRHSRGEVPYLGWVLTSIPLRDLDERTLVSLHKKTTHKLNELYWANTVTPHTGGRCFQLSPEFVLGPGDQSSMQQHTTIICVCLQRVSTIGQQSGSNMWSYQNCSIQWKRNTVMQWWNHLPSVVYLYLLSNMVRQFNYSKYTQPKLYILYPLQ